MRQLLGQQEALMGTHASVDRPLQAGALIAQAAVSQICQRGGVSSAGYKFGQNGATGGAQSIAGNIPQLDVRSLDTLAPVIARLTRCPRTPTISCTSTEWAAVCQQTAPFG